MRSHLFLLPACVLTLAAQDAWEALMTSGYDRALEPHLAWTLVRKARMGSAIRDAEELMPALASRDLRLRTGPEEALVALGRKLGLSQPPIWALVDPRGQVRLHGNAEPSPKALREDMDSSGWIPRWERRQAFLKAHPDHGDAVGDELLEVGWRAFLQRIKFIRQAAEAGKGATPGKVQETPRRKEPSMGKLLDTPYGQSHLLIPFREAFTHSLGLPQGDPDCTGLWAEMPVMELGELANTEQLEAVYTSVLREVESHLHRNPPREDLWEVWVTMALLLQEPPAEALIASLKVAPGTTWPIRRVAEALTINLDPQRRLDRAESELVGAGEAKARMAAWAGVKVRALLDLKRDEEARLWILEARRKSPEAFDGLTPEHWVDEKHPARASLAAALEQSLPGADPGPPSGFGLVVLGRPAWLAEFEALDRRPELDAWGHGGLFAPGELILLHLEGKEELELRTRLNLPPGPRWVLAREPGECLAQGTEAPDPKRLAQLLRKADPPLLERLEAFLQRHPDHRQAQEKLVEILSERMPHPRLELKLAQACGTLGEARILRKEDFKPQVPLWEPIARKAVRAADARLARWPESLEAWMAWMDWQSMLPSPASPTERLRGLAVWKSVTRGGPGPLPLDVATGVARRLEAAGRWQALADWGLHQWEGGWRKAMGWGAVGPADEDADARERRVQTRKELLALAQLTLRALFTLDRKADVQHLQEEWRAADPTHGMGQGRVKP